MNPARILLARVSRPDILRRALYPVRFAQVSNQTPEATVEYEFKGSQIDFSDAKRYTEAVPSKQWITEILDHISKNPDYYMRMQSEGFQFNECGYPVLRIIRKDTHPTPKPDSKIALVDGSSLHWDTLQEQRTDAVLDAIEGVNSKLTIIYGLSFFAFIAIVNTVSRM